jgi:hypothetical protein
MFLRNVGVERRDHTAPEPRQSDRQIHKESNGRNHVFMERRACMPSVLHFCMLGCIGATLKAVCVVWPCESVGVRAMYLE